MKEGWKIVKLGEVCDFEGGSQPPKSEWTKEPCEGYVRMLQIRDFTQSRKADVEYVKISKKLRLCKANDILIGRYGASVGKILTGLEGAYNVAIIKSIPDETRIIKSYIRRFFEAPNFQSLLFKVCTQRAAQAGFSKEDIVDTEFSLPPLEEQHRIVSILDASFEKIDALKKNAEENLKNAKALFQQVLAQELKPKEGWVKKKLGEVCNNISYGTSLPSSENGIYKYLRMNNITLDGTLDLNNLKYITVPDKELAKCMVEKGDLLFNRTNSHELVGKSCVFENDEKMVIAGYIIRIRLNKEIAPKFANYYINLQRRLGYLKPLIVGAVHQANISAKSIQTINFVYPTLEEQHRIVRTLDTLSEKCRRLEQIAQQTIRECDALKQSILRQVFSGEL